MYRYNEGTDYVVDVKNVDLIIPTNAILTEEQQKNQALVTAHAEYLAFIANGGIVLEQTAQILSGT